MLVLLLCAGRIVGKEEHNTTQHNTYNITPPTSTGGSLASLSSLSPLSPLASLSYRIFIHFPIHFLIHVFVRVFIPAVFVLLMY